MTVLEAMLLVQAFLLVKLFPLAELAGVVLDEAAFSLLAALALLAVL